jgi:hypothetical protein
VVAGLQLIKAIRRGEVKKLDDHSVCVDCGRVAKNYDHRYYSRPLDVVPVCVSCNQKRGPANNLFEMCQKILSSAQVGIQQ